MAAPTWWAATPRLDPDDYRRLGELYAPETADSTSCSKRVWPPPTTEGPLRRDHAFLSSARMPTRVLIILALVAALVILAAGAVWFVLVLGST